ncbi:2-amino-4-hydroxy-6-hydroxymethyldihydropteridine diphosphokinase [Desulfovibrio litoralis]|uniref:2-amino-4-hydroxy-6-hydroxymethyldihydropteridine pyrophosphokinase n=1 Tax=Desulfovibrio litoralis DSM 11393 TaxID=1121455 RepID=A0A1M7SYP5_9BACT|nr:2-amino-4-hydroxy-6-hydroxymethyldihydropteridine diphosphokinase [Desulfovibrio litoralis]SHN63622.1 2-amino-4-hydroxy-6-hydroxymethyldihydropteridinediphosphokinase [Desulfovibrio litoralis DSM 11393]
MSLKNIQLEHLKKHLAYISLGSNIGDSRKHLKSAREALSALPGISISSLSRVYKTEPQEIKEQPWFYNQVLCLSCHHAVTPEGLLESLLDIEKSLGRKREGVKPKGPRTIDLDLLFFDQEQCNTKELVLPHPRLHERAFVLVPLLEINPDLCLPNSLSLNTLLKSLPYRLENDKILQS